MILILCIAFLVVLTVGFLSLNESLKKVLGVINFSNDYRNAFIEIANNFSSGGTFLSSREPLNSEKYMWLTRHSSKMQEMMGYDGIVNYTAPFQRFNAPNYQIILNTIPKFRNHITATDINLVDDSLLRFMGKVEGQSEKARKYLQNPIIWLRQGFREIFSLPFYLLSWFGILSDRAVMKIKMNLVFKVISGVAGILSFVSAIVTILLGYKQTLSLLSRIFK